MVTEIKRDLVADLALCEAASPGPWKREPAFDCEIYSEADLCGSVVSAVGDDMTYVEIAPNNERFILEAREGWPHAIRRALAAEKKWAKLREVVVTNATGGGGENINDYDIMLNVMNDIDTEVSENAET